MLLFKKFIPNVKQIVSNCGVYGLYVIPQNAIHNIGDDIMHNSTRFIFFTICLLKIILYNNVLAQWVQTNGPYGGFIASFAISGTNLFVGAGGGVFLSTDNGTSWTEANSGLTNTDVWSLVVLDSNLFVGTNGGVFLSTDNGKNWNDINSGLMNTLIRNLVLLH